MIDSSGQYGQQTVVQQAVEGMLAVLPVRIVEWVRIGAIPHWVDADLLTCLTGDSDLSQTVLAYFQRLSLIHRDSEGRFRYHTHLREYLLAWWHEGYLDRCQYVNQTLVAYFNNLIQTSPPLEQVVYAQEALYHLLQADEVRGLQMLQERFEDLCATLSDECGGGIDRVVWLN